MNPGLHQQIQDLHLVVDAESGIQLNPGLHQLLQDCHLILDAWRGHWLVVRLSVMGGVKVR